MQSPDPEITIGKKVNSARIKERVRGRMFSVRFNFFLSCFSKLSTSKSGEGGHRLVWKQFPETRKKWIMESS